MMDGKELGQLYLPNKKRKNLDVNYMSQKEDMFRKKRISGNPAKCNSTMSCFYKHGSIEQLNFALL